MPDVFLHAAMDEVIHMRFEGAMAELIIQPNTVYFSLFVDVKNKKVFGMLINCAINRK